MPTKMLAKNYILTFFKHKQKRMLLFTRFFKNSCVTIQHCTKKTLDCQFKLDPP